VKAFHVAILAVLFLGAAGTIHAKTLAFRAALNGKTVPTNTSSSASGIANVRVDLARRTVSVDLTVDGISLDGLWDRLVTAPIGPIHFHKYGSRDHSGDDVVLVLPLPYGPAYRSTSKGFRVKLSNFSYDTGAALVESNASFDSFVAALQSGTVVLNIHTDKFQNGEISGTIVDN
jgi:CHRD domain